MELVVRATFGGKTFWLNEEGKLTSSKGEAHRFGVQMIAESCATKIGNHVLPFFKSGHVVAESAR